MYLNNFFRKDLIFMRKLSKILVLVLALAMMFSLASMFTVSAAQPEYLYLTPNANWKIGRASCRERV